MFTRTRSRVAAVALTAAALVGASAPAHAADPRPATSNPAAAAAGWLASQLRDGDHFATDFGGTLYNDQGLTADAIIAFAAAGVAGDAGNRATKWLASPAVLSEYVGDGGSTVWAGATAKTALVAQVQGRNPKNFGGVNLISRLKGRMQASGRFTDKSGFGDFSNALGQSIAIIALERIGTAPAKAVSYLAGARCADGGTPVQFEQKDCVASIDATAFAVQALLAAGNKGAAKAGLDYLEAQQADNGGFGTPRNANSTGLAAQALRAGGRIAAADDAVKFLLRLQVKCGGKPVNQGAIRYTGEAFDASTAPRATAQAIPALARVSLLTVSNDGATPESASLACAG